MTSPAVLPTFLVLLFSLTGVFGQTADPRSCENYGYEVNGPNEWADFCPACGGNQQSPINIVIADIEVEPLPEIVGTFWKRSKRGMRFSLRNDEFTVILEPIVCPRPTIKGGPLRGTYLLEHVVFTWGSNDSVGSEHTIDGEQFPFESEIAFFKEDYGSYVDALGYADGVLLISNVYNISSEDNPGFTPIVNALCQVQYPGDATNVREPVILDKILSGQGKDSYCMYNGSLTIPPCTENILWFVYPPDATISHSQVNQFRNLRSPEGQLVDNFRPVQPLNGRVVKHSGFNYQ